jgi:hypothetical protein
VAAKLPKASAGLGVNPANALERVEVACAAGIYITTPKYTRAATDALSAERLDEFI